MTIHSKIELDFVESDTNAWAQHWLELRGSDLVPPRRRFNPMKITALLPYMVLIERLSDDLFRFRLIGTNVVTRLGRDDTGFTFSRESYDPASPFIITLINVLDRPCGYHMLTEETYRSGAKAPAEHLGLPMSDKDGKPHIVATFSRAMSQKYSNILHDTTMSHATGTAHRYIDIGAGVPPPIAGCAVYVPGSRDSKVEQLTNMASAMRKSSR